jgi:hypothetical protein
MKKSTASIFLLFLLLGYRAASANSVSGVAVFASGLTTTGKVFDAAIDLLKQSGFPPATSDREGGRIEASVTLYHTINAGKSGDLLEDTSYWKLTISSSSEGQINLLIDRGSALKIDEHEIVGFLRNLVVGLRLNPSRVTVTIGGETKILSQWKRAAKLGVILAPNTGRYSGQLRCRSRLACRLG